MVKRRKLKEDPYLKREAKKYQHPVPSREFIIEQLEQPFTFNELLDIFSLTCDEEKEGLRRRLKAMQRDGQLICNRRGQYGLVEAMDLVSGSIYGHRDGFGFLIADDDNTADIFLSSREMRCVFPGDRVLVRVMPGERQRREGVIVEVLERNTSTLVGRFCKENGIAFIDPNHKAISHEVIIPQNKDNKAKKGQYVLVKIVSQPDKRHQPIGQVLKILGDELTPGMEVELAIRSHEIPFEWPNALEQTLHQFGTKVQRSDMKGRSDFRHLPFVTIDGEDAKDFDDALYCEPIKGLGWRLYVAIADVSHYVKYGSALDQEAEKRGNSVYFPSRVIPMLPEVLSNELCSLKPNVDRLVIVCEMTINNKAQVLHYQFHEAVIHSQGRLTYNTVAGWLSGTQKPDTLLFPSIQALYKLYKILLKEKKWRGAVEFKTIETQVLFGKGGKINQIVPIDRNDAHKMVEEAMLLANVTVAHFLEKAKLPTLYRVHKSPEVSKLLALRDFLKAFGLQLGGGLKPTGQDYSNLLKRIEHRPDAHLLQIVMLRSMPQAVYCPDNLGHFGLSYEQYCHFTSPIRRYPDLLVHRAIRHLLRKRSIKKFVYTHEQMALISKHCSMTERRADLATRDALDWLKCDYMRAKLGQEFNGVIMDVTNFGVFIELIDIYVQGLLHVTSLSNDYYDYDQIHHLLRGKRSGKVYRLGDSIRVIIARVDLDQRRIDFDLADNPGNKSAKKVQKRRYPRRK